MNCVKEGGWRHFITHIIGIHSVARCCALAGRSWSSGFIEGINKASTKKVECTMDKPSLTNRPDKPVTPKKHLANYCMENPNHQMFKVTDGARCVECNGLVNVKEVTKAEHYSLPSYKELCRRNEKPGKSLSVSVDMNTDKLQLKLQAIAKHAEALADELDRIDNAWQCDCGCEEKEEILIDNETVFVACFKCGKPIDDELPTQLESSE